MVFISRDMMEISRCETQFRTDKLAPMGLKSCHGSYLIEICREPGISQDKLAQKICINKSNVARQAAFLEEEGFITRTPSPQDKRVMMLHPTEKTTAIFKELLTVMGEWEQMVTAGLCEEEKEQLKNLLQKLKHNATEWMEQQ